MRIRKIYISAFGGLKDFTLELGDKINVVFGENEVGKTTVMTFILCMFYGTKTKVQKVGANPRIKYAPFDNSPFGGRIYFENGGKEFCLERQFLKSDSTDKVTLTNCDTGETVSVPSDVGTTLFGMGAEAFKTSMFIGAERGTVPGDEAVGELNGRLSSVALTGDENTSFEKIEGRIEKAKEKVLSKTGRAGILAKSRQDKASLEARLENAKSDAVRKSEIVKTVEELRQQGISLGEEYMELKRITDSKDDIKTAEKLKEYLDLKAELDKLNESLKMADGKIADSNFVSSLKFCLSKEEAAKEKCEDIKKDIENIEKALDLSDNLSAEQAAKDIEESKRNLETLNAEKQKNEENTDKLSKELDLAEAEAQDAATGKKPANKVLLILGLIFASCGTVGGFLYDKYFFISALCGLVIIISGFIFRPDNSKKISEAKEKVTEIKGKIAEAKSACAEISEKITGETGKINMLAGVINADRSVKERRKEELEVKKQKLAEETEKLNALKKETEKLSGGETVGKEALEAMEKQAEAQKNIKLKLGYLSKDLGGISYEAAEKKLEAINGSGENGDVDFEAAEQKKEQIGEQMTEIKQQITRFETELKTGFRNSEQPEILEREMALLDEKIEAQEGFVEACNTVIEVLGESFAGIRRGYGSVLEEKMLENFALLTDGKYKNVGINKSLDITVEDKNIFGMREVDYLSTGTVDQAFLSLRLAICSLIGEKGTTPVMLDDALSNYDDIRAETAIKFLNTFAENNQVILFTCHNSIVALADKNGIKTQNLR